MTVMRAKLQVSFINDGVYSGVKSNETLTMIAVPKSSGYPVDGSDEDNTFAKFSPQADFRITIANPELWGKFSVGEKYYVDFTKAE